jgi:hypothetical protein
MRSPRVHDVKHCKQMKASMNKHLQSFDTTSQLLETYHRTSLRQLASECSEPIQIAYSLLCNSLASIPRTLRVFPMTLSPVTMFLDEIAADRPLALRALDVYQSRMARVRREGDSDSAVAEERDALLEFAAALTKLNRKSNNFLLALLPSYENCCHKFATDIHSVVRQLDVLTETVADTQQSDEERNLEDDLRRLQSNAIE